MEKETQCPTCEAVKNLIFNTPATVLIDELDEVFSLAMLNPDFRELEPKRADDLRYSIRLIQKFLVKIDQKTA